MSNHVTIQTIDHIAHVRLNRPHKYNALNPEMFQAIIEAGEKIRNDRTIRAIILSGEGPGFCAGLDFKGFMEMESGQIWENDAIGQLLLQRSSDGIANYAQLVAYIWKQQAVPVIAAISHRQSKPSRGRKSQF